MSEGIPGGREQDAKPKLPTLRTFTVALWDGEGNPVEEVVHAHAVSVEEAGVLLFSRAVMTDAGIPVLHSIRAFRNWHDFREEVEFQGLGTVQ